MILKVRHHFNHFDICLIQINHLVLSYFLLTNNLTITSTKYKFSIKGSIDFGLKNELRKNYKMFFLLNPCK